MSADYELNNGVGTNKRLKETDPKEFYVDLDFEGLDVEASIAETDIVVTQKTSENPKRSTWSAIKALIGGVQSVFGRTGSAITAQSGDYEASQVTGAFDKTADDSDDITEGGSHLFLTSAERTILGNTSGVNTGDQDLSALALKSNVLEKDNTTPFTPDADYEPATKKYVDDSGSGDVSASSNLDDNKLVRGDGGAKGVQATGVDVDDNNNLSGIANLEIAGQANTPINTLTDGATIATNCNLGNIHTITLGGNRTLANPANLKSGATYIWIIRQDGTGSRTLSFGSAFKFAEEAAPTLTTDANAVDIITGVSDGTNIYVVGQLDFS